MSYVDFEPEINDEDDESEDWEDDDWHEDYEDYDDDYYNHDDNHNGLDWCFRLFLGIMNNYHYDLSL